MPIQPFSSAGSDTVMKEVQIPNSLGMFAMWFNQCSGETHKDELYVTIHSMGELREFRFL